MQRPTDADPGYTAPAVLSVTALNAQVARLLERSFPLVWIGGEISNFTRAASPRAKATRSRCARW
jgi:exodeoxyribonuclease VII large subunit